MQLSLWSAKYPPFWTQCVQCWFGSLLAYKLLYLCIVGTATASSVRIILLNIMLKMKQAKKSHGYAFHTSTLTQSKFTIYENINILNLCCQYHVWSQFISRYDIEITHTFIFFLPRFVISGPPSVPMSQSWQPIWHSILLVMIPTGELVFKVSSEDTTKHLYSYFTWLSDELICIFICYQ